MAVIADHVGRSAGRPVLVAEGSTRATGALAANNSRHRRATLSRSASCRGEIGCDLSQSSGYMAVLSTSGSAPSIEER